MSKDSLFLVLAILAFVCGNCQQNGSTIKFVITDFDTKTETPVRVKITDSHGNVVSVPEEVISIMYGRDDQPERYSFQPDSSFYVDGNFQLDLIPGTYQIDLSKGMEYLDQSQKIEVSNRQGQQFKFEMERWINMVDSGWYSADDHIHIRRSPRENPLILKWIEAEGLNVGVLLQMGDFWTTYFGQYAFGKEGVYQENQSMLTAGQEEPRTHQVGHTIALAADDFVRFRGDYYLYDKVFDKVHDLNGITGYAHQGMSFNGFRGMTMDVLDRKVDFLELLQFCVDGGPLLTKNYYHFLDLGYKLTATAGSDFPWCGNGPRFGTPGPPWNARIGNVRFYTKIAGEFTYESWKENLKSGHTFVSSGPMLLFQVNDKFPGDEINISGKQTVSISANAYGHHEQVPLSKLEIIAHGKVIKEIAPGGNGQSKNHLSLDFDLEVNKGIWIAACVDAGPAQVAHTTPVYISIDGKGFQNEETKQDLLTLNEQYLQELENELNKPSEQVHQRAWWYKNRLEDRIDYTRKIIQSLKAE